MKLSRDNLTVRATLEEVVRDNSHNRVPFGFAFDDWQRLLKLRQEADELWYFEPPDKSSLRIWGVALVRQGEILSTVITAVG